MGMTWRRFGVYLWTSPTSLAGLALLVPTLCTHGRARVVHGVLELSGGAAAWMLRRCTLLPGGASAMTLGHVVIAIDEATHDRTRAHERVHVRQAERWGPLFFPAYAVASLIALARGQHFYRDNAFEREAYEHG
jgi:hypothetical protein